MSITFVLAASLGATVALFAVLWAVTRSGTDISVIDAFWGPGFIVAGLVSVLLAPERHATAWLILACLGVWGVRLAVYMARKHGERGGEDPRYRAMRDRVGVDFPRWSLTRVFLLQAVVLWLVATPVHVGIATATHAPVFPLVAAGLVVFSVGFAIEVIADLQMTRFRRSRPSRDVVHDRGLWGLSRHPNYFGEALLWWGLGLMAHGSAGGAPWGTVAYLGPALMTGLLLKVSGVALLEPMLERDKPGYAAYRRRVSAFIPWWPKAP